MRSLVLISIQFANVRAAYRKHHYSQFDISPETLGRFFPVPSIRKKANGMLVTLGSKHKVSFTCVLIWKQVRLLVRHFDLLESVSSGLQTYLRSLCD